MKEKFLKWISASFDTNTKGLSARKASAFVIMLCVVILHIAYIKKAFMENDFSQMITVLITDYSFVLALLGMTTWGPNNSAVPTTPEK